MFMNEYDGRKYRIAHHARNRTVIVLLELLDKPKKWLLEGILDYGGPDMDEDQYLATLKGVAQVSETMYDLRRIDGV